MLSINFVYGSCSSFIRLARRVCPLFERHDSIFNLESLKNAEAERRREQNKDTKPSTPGIK